MFRQQIRLSLFAVLAAFMLALTGCGGGGGDDPPMMPDPPPDPQMVCEDAGGRYNADGTCTSAADLVMERQEMQRGAIMTAINTATNAVNAVNNDSTDAEVSAADTAIGNARTAIADAADLPQAEKDANTGTVNALATLLSGAKTARMNAMDEDDRIAREAMAATAAKLYAGISAPMGTADAHVADDRFAAYNADDTAIEVWIGNGTDVPTAATATLSEDKDTMVAANHGWAGKRYADPAGGDSYEAYVYSDVEAPTMGKKFGSAAAVTPTGAYQYQLTDGALPAAQFVAMNVDFTSVTRTAGTETFRLPDPNPSGADVILIPGTYHGVSGTYNCTPSAPASGCSAAVAANGFTVSSGDTWTFTPSNAEARVRDAADTMYVSYGWWLRKAENNGPFTASAFVDYKGGDGTAELASGIDALNGTATYMGGAAGKYALSSSTGGTNDAGHFTARATLTANFTTNTGATAITGTIDMFMGADGEARDWSVKLNGSAILDAGTFGDSDDGTEWTIGGTAAADDGSWSGRFYDPGTDLVPEVAAGTFFSTYGQDGRMVGAFGANKQ